MTGENACRKACAGGRASSSADNRSSSSATAAAGLAPGSHTTEAGPDGVVTIRRPGDPSTTLTMPDVLLATPDSLWLDPRSLPARPLASWNVAADLPETTRCADLLPVLYPGPPPYFRQDST